MGRARLAHLRKPTFGGFKVFLDTEGIISMPAISGELELSEIKLPGNYLIKHSKLRGEELGVSGQLWDGR